MVKEFIMFSKLRYLNRSTTAGGSLRRAKTCIDQTAIEIQNTHHVTGSCFFCQGYQKKNDTHCETNGTYLKVNKTLSRHLGTGLPWENKKLHFKHQISCVKHSQLRGNNLDQKAQGTMAGQEKGLLRPLKSKHVNNIVQSHFFSTTSARSFSAPSTVLQGRDTDKDSSWISRFKNIVTGKKTAEKSFSTEDPVKIMLAKEKPLILLHAKEEPLIETDVVVAQDESFWLMLRGCDTIEEVLTLMEPKIERKELGIDQYLEVLQRLKIIVYESLQQQYASWEDEDVIPGIFINLLLNDSTISEFEFLGKSSCFQRLQDNLVQFLPEMTASQFTASLSGFVWLGLDPTSSTMVRFMSHVDDFTYKDFTINTLHILSVCLMRFARPDLLIVKYIYPRLKALIEDGHVIDPERKSLFSLIFLGHVGIPDIDIGIWLSQQILKIVETSDHLKDPFMAGWCLKFCSKMITLLKESNPRLNFINTSLAPDRHSERLSQLASAKNQLTDIVIINLMDVCGSLMGNDVARVAGSAFKLGIYGLPWADMIKQRSLDLLFDETLPIAQRLSALLGLKGYVDMDNETREKIEKVILTMLEDADVWNTTHVLDYLGHVQVNSPELVRLCEKKIVQTFDKMMEYRILSKKLFVFLAKCAMQDVDKHLTLQTKLLDKKNIGFNQDLILDYIITQKLWLHTSAQVLYRVNEHAARCSFRHFVRILTVAAENKKWSSFKSRLKSKGNLLGETSKAVRAFEMCCAIRYFKATEANIELDNLLYLSSKLINISPTILCQNTVMRSVEKATKSMLFKPKNFSRLLHILSQVKIEPGCISARVFERVLDVFDQSNIANEKDAERMLVIIRNWFSVEIEKVTAPLKGKIHDVLWRKLHLLTANKSLITTVFNIESLCILGIFPEAALTDLLKEDTMVKIDEIIDKSDKSGTEESIKLALTSINRCVVIDKKEMNISWFMGTCVEDSSKQLSSTAYEDEWKTPKAQREWEYKLMCEILGEGNFAAEREVEYGYMLSFACLMNKDNNLMPFQDKNFTFAKELGLQRVAVEFTRPTQSWRDNFTNRLKKDHLQKLGYRLVELNDWEYHSTAWSSPKECYSYYKRKILGQLDKELMPPWYSGIQEEELGKTHGGHKSAQGF